MDTAQVDEALRAIREDRTRGASELARAGLRLVAEAAEGLEAGSAGELCAGLRAAARGLIATRASMAPIANLVGSWLAGLTAIERRPLAEARARAAGSARALIAESEEAASQAAAHLAAYLGPNRTVITHSLSGTVLAVFERLRGEGLRVIVTESRPLNEGHLLARRLSERGVPTTLITDAQMGLFAGQADAAVVGADSLLADGSVVNKAGTYLLALAAREAGVPFYVCCEGFKRRSAEMGAPELEAMDPSELGAPVLESVRVENVYFDITPPRLIDAWVDETGLRRSGVSPRAD